MNGGAAGSERITNHNVRDNNDIQIRNEIAQIHDEISSHVQETEGRRIATAQIISAQEESLITRKW